MNCSCQSLITVAEIVLKNRGEHARLEGVSSVGKSSAKAVKIFQYLMAESHGNVDKEKK